MLSTQSRIYSVADVAYATGPGLSGGPQIIKKEKKRKSVHVYFNKWNPIQSHSCSMHKQDECCLLVSANMFKRVINPRGPRGLNVRSKSEASLRDSWGPRRESALYQLGGGFNYHLAINVKTKWPRSNPWHIPVNIGVCMVPLEWDYESQASFQFLRSLRTLVARRVSSALWVHSTLHWIASLLFIVDLILRRVCMTSSCISVGNQWSCLCTMIATPVFPLKWACIVL